MKRITGVMAVLAAICSYSTMANTAVAQWYANPQATTGQGGNGYGNPMQYATNSLLYGSGFVPGTNILPGGGGGIVTGSGIGTGGTPGANAASGATGANAASGATTESTDSGDGGSQPVSTGYSFTSDPISAYTNAVYTGMSNLVRAEGSYNRQTARGLIDYEKARALYSDNQLRIFSARRAIYRAKLAARAEDLEYEQAAAARSNAFLAAHRPLPLDSRHLDHSSGSIRWPAVLMEPEFDDLRKKVEADFEARAKNGYDADANIDMKKHVIELKNQLHDEVLKKPLEHYSQARQFLDQLLASVE